MNSDITPKRIDTNIKREKLTARRLLNLSLFLRINTMGRPIREIIAATKIYTSKTFNFISKNI